ncbi:hypothetical protein [Paracoccus marcusii]|uniref:hypothetical protein n=1 Tax=Paracoccus marcusii TaxID=59779 RepID=UPI0024906DE3|nr:hypothetical protein [Paracoccus marcusii]
METETLNQLGHFKTSLRQIRFEFAKNAAGQFQADDYPHHITKYSDIRSHCDGCAGPEAIMPLKRNAQGRLGVEVSGGGGSQVNVYHTINLSANGDDSVNRIINAQIPRITEASKRAVIDANRRSQKGFR